jgi:diadenylate cyclase
MSPGRAAGSTWTEVLHSATSLARRARVRHLLVACDELAPELSRGALRTKIIYAMTSPDLAAQVQEQGMRAVAIPRYAFSRFEKVKVALVAAFSAKLINRGDRVACLTGIEPRLDRLDAIMTLVFGQESFISNDLTAWSDLTSISGDVPAQLLEAVIGIASSIAQEGYEGRPYGAIFVLGDSTAVMEKSRQLTINPFQGYSENDRNVLDPMIRESVKCFAILDGATVIREDGVVLASGRFLDTGEGLDLGLGLGTRHQAAAAITQTTGALALVVAQTSGVVRVFKEGRIRLEIQPAFRRMNRGVS